MTPSGSAPFGCRRHDAGTGVVRVALTGALDAVGAPSLDQLLCSVHAEGSVAVIDLDELAQVDAAGALVLCEAASRARAQGRRLVVVNSSPGVERELNLLDVAGELKLVAAAPPALPDDLMV